MNAAALVYFGGGTLLFFFWVYGIASFIRDVRYKGVPAVRQYVRGRRRQRDEARKAHEREESERQLY